LTPAVLDLLRSHGARATFFVVGRYVDAHPAIAERAAADGHELGNHTFDHIDCAHERDDEVILDQLVRTGDAIERVVGTRPTLVRPPYGKGVCRVDRIAARAEVPTTVLWSVEAWDWSPDTSADQISSRIIADTGPGDIVLLHDGAPPDEDATREATLAALPAILEHYAARSFELTTVGELLAGPG
jgi:peptidoglycan/xylan/chitin deacetylase (PgdA/CDA1 family)